MIEFQSLNKWYGPLHVLNDVNLSIGKGEVVVVCGPSGSGKSTLIRCVNGLETFQKGGLTVDGARLGTLKTRLRNLRMEVGFVFQQFNLYPHKTALENVVLAPIHVRKLPRAEAEARGRALLEKVGLGDKMGNYPHQLSGGQQQRVAIVRSLAMQPKIMLFDEPTSALDPEMINEVLDVMVVARAGRHDDDGRDSRNGFRPAGGRSGHLHGSRRHRRSCETRDILHRAAKRPDAGFPRQDPAALGSKPCQFGWDVPCKRV
jgi:polar amino acid transport system ATP-binding protein